MIRSRILMTMLLTVLLPAALTFGADNRNAATWYRKAAEKRLVLTQADWDVIEAWRVDPSGVPPQALRDALAKAGPALNDFRRGTRLEYADFELDYSQGFELPLPHLGELRGVSRIMQAEALLHLHDGDTAAAANAVSAMYRAAEHFNNDRIIISSLVGAAMFNTGDTSLLAGLDRAAFNSADCEAMLKGLNQLDPDDPFNMVESVAMEQEVAANWIEEKYGGDGGREQMLENFEFFGGDEEAAARFAALSNEEFAAELERYDRGMDQYVAAVSMEDRDAARAELQRLEEEIEAGEHGVIASVFMPAISKYYDLMCKAKDRIAERKETLAGLVNGQIKPEEEANAALFYGRAIERMREIKQESFAAVCAFDAGEIETMDDALINTLANAEAIVDFVREGSQKKRCDFALLRSKSEVQFCPDYVGGMRDLFRLLHADAVRLLREGEADAAADRLEVGYRVIAHLSGDEPILSAALAHHLFLRANDLAASALHAGSLAETHRAQLHRAADRISRKDPFGYIASIAKTREKLGWKFYYMIARTGAEYSVYKTAPEIVHAWDGDEVLYVLAILDTMSRADKSDPQEKPDDWIDPITRLDDVIALHDLERVRGEVRLIAPLLAANDLDFFAGLEIPRFARIAQRMRSARADLRRGVAALQPARDGEEQ